MARRDVVEEAVSELGDAETMGDAMRRFQRTHLQATLERTDWNLTETARRLDITRSHVYNLIRAHGLRRTN